MMTFDDFFWTMNGWHRDEPLFGVELFDTVDDDNDDIETDS